MHDFSSSLRSISQGRAKFKMQFDSYQAMSYDQQRKLTEEYNKTATEVVAWSGSKLFTRLPDLNHLNRRPGNFYDNGWVKNQGD